MLAAFSNSQHLKLSKFLTKSDVKVLNLPGLKILKKLDMG